MRYPFALVLLFTFTVNLFTQTHNDNIPWGIDKDLSNIPIVKTPRVSHNRIYKQERKNPSYFKPYQFAKTFQTDFSINNSGRWVLNADGKNIWLIRVKSKNAYSITLIFKEFYIPKYAKVFIYNKDNNYIKGPFTSANNLPSKILPIEPVMGDEIVIEYQEPVNTNSKPLLAIGQIGHDYRNVLKDNYLKDAKYNTSAYCNADINCSEGSNYQNIKRSVCRLQISGSRFCTGTLINNTAQNGKPYVLTANHCISNSDEANTVIAVFNYESYTCNGPDGSVAQEIRGAKLKATTDKLDFSLIELSSGLPISYKPYFAGWNADYNNTGYVVTIHHPKGDVKKISVDFDSVETSTYISQYNPNSHWRVKRWDIGITETGSSGSALFNSNNQIIGDLTGGEAYCSNPINDYYSKFCLSYDYYDPDSTKCLKYWLDPLKTGQKSISGISLLSIKKPIDAELFNIIEPTSNNCNNLTLRPSVIIKNKGTTALEKLIAGYIINSDTTYLNWIGLLQSDEIDTLYFEQIKINVGSYTFKAFVSNPNDTIDMDTSNNYKSINFNIIDGKKVQLDLITDRFGSETTWKICDSAYNTLYEGGPFPDNYEQKLSDQFCLDYGTKFFTIYDSNKDGICCNFGNGNFTVSDPETKHIYGYGGYFTDSLRIMFNVLPSNVVKADFYSQRTKICVGSSVKFLNTSQNANSYQWIFPGGYPDSSDGYEPVVIYYTPGKFDVKLKVNNGFDEKFISNYIEVTEKPIVQFEINDISDIDSIGSFAKAIVTGGTPPYYYHWNNEAQTQQIYGLKKGTYSVAVVDSVGCIVASSFNIGKTGIIELTKQKDKPYYILQNSYNGDFTVFINDMSYDKFFIYDVTGKLLLHFSTVRNSFQFSIKRNGLYFIKSINNYGNLYFEKFIIQ
jgi:V8-like Glu-specific endopeptidase